VRRLPHHCLKASLQCIGGEIRLILCDHQQRAEAKRVLAGAEDL
jgi:hypothetical protein